jgi:ssDNA-binding Zn-finger/Zn-ribbon topoisomerase 1
MGEVRGIIWLVGLAGLIWVIWQWEQCRRLTKVGVPAKMQVERALRPRTPEDCPACREQSHHEEHRHRKEPVQPWSEVKSRRGRRKRLNTEGYACINRACQYYGSGRSGMLLKILNKV